LRVDPLDAAHSRNPPAFLVALESNGVPLHRLNQPFPRHGSRSRSIDRKRPGPRSRPSWTGTVVKQSP
jgi:hypothetical protein